MTGVLRGGTRVIFGDTNPLNLSRSEIGGKMKELFETEGDRDHRTSKCRM